MDKPKHFNSRRLIRRIAIWGVTILVIAGAIWGISKLASNVQLPSSSGTLSKPVDASDNIIGSASASITLVEYSDFQCPACAAFNPILQKFMAESDAQGKVRLVYRYFPLQQHANAQISAQAAQAAALQGKFWEMHDKLFSNQAVWEGQSNTGARATFLGYAKDIGLDLNKFSSDIDSAKVKDKISADYSSGIDSNVDATPTFFINGVKMPPPQSYEEFKSFVLNGVPTQTQ